MAWTLLLVCINKKDHRAFYPTTFNIVSYPFEVATPKQIKLFIPTPAANSLLLQALLS
ncbi:hypothetical protein AB9M62_46685 [Bacillales bacterium AN1005]